MTSNPSCAQFKHSNMNSRPGRRRDDTLPETRSLISGRKHRERCDAQLDELQALEKELTNFQRILQTAFLYLGEGNKRGGLQTLREGLRLLCPRLSCNPEGHIQQHLHQNLGLAGPSIHLTGASVPYANHYQNGTNF